MRHPDNVQGHADIDALFRGCRIPLDLSRSWLYKTGIQHVHLRSVQSALGKHPKGNIGEKST